MTAIGSSRLFVKNLPVKYTDEQVKFLFGKHGEVTDCKLLKDKNGKSRRCAYVGYSKESDAAKALKKLNGTTLGISKLNVEYSKQMKELLSKPKKKKETKKDFLKDKVDKDLIDSDDEENNETNDSENNIAEISDSGRLFVRNLSYLSTESDLKTLFDEHGTLTELILPIDETTDKPKGFCFVEYQMPENAVKALNALDGTIFMGRILHILPGKERDKPAFTQPRVDKSANTSYKKEKLAKMKENATTDISSWNSLFVGSNAVADQMAKKYDLSKAELLKRDDAAVQLALGESQIVNDIKDYLINHGVKLDTFSRNTKRSDKIILVKNLPSGALPSELRKKFESFGALGRIVMPPAGLAAIVEFHGSINAKKAFTSVAYSRFVDRPLYLEWAPMNCLEEATKSEVKQENLSEPVVSTKKEPESEPAKNVNDQAKKKEDDGAMLFVKNLNFKTDEEKLKILFHRYNPLDVQVSRRLDKGKYLSMGYGFVKLKTEADCMSVIKTLQGVELDGHRIEIKLSKKKEQTQAARYEAKNQVQPSNSCKLIVRNVPFQCTADEIRNLFSTFGTIKSCRTPKTHTGRHRGFCFVELSTATEAKSAFDALKLSTHIYGRRLVIEWADTDVEDVGKIREKTKQNFRGKKRKFEMPNDQGDNNDGGNGMEE